MISRPETDCRRSGLQLFAAINGWRPRTRRIEETMGKAVQRDVHEDPYGLAEAA
jgi:hypothetical protein